MRPPAALELRSALERVGAELGDKDGLAEPAELPELAEVVGSPRVEGVVVEADVVEEAPVDALGLPRAGGVGDLAVEVRPGDADRALEERVQPTLERAEVELARAEDVDPIPQPLPGTIPGVKRVDSTPTFRLTSRVLVTQTLRRSRGLARGERGSRTASVVQPRLDPDVEVALQGDRRGVDETVDLGAEDADRVRVKLLGDRRRSRSPCSSVLQTTRESGSGFGACLVPVS